MAEQTEQKYYTIVTNLGTELIAKAAQNGTKVNITHIAAGDGNGENYKPTSNMTSLKREIWRGSIQNYEIDAIAKNVIKISGVIPKEVGHFVLREIALFDDKNNMIAICNAPDLLKAVLEEGALTEAVVYMSIAVTNTQAVTIQVNGSAIFATEQELEAHKIDESAHQTLFDKKADKTDMENALKNKADKVTFETHINSESAHQALFDNKADKIETQTTLNGKVDKTDFTGTNIGSLLEVAGWQSGTVINNIVDGEKTGSIKQVNAIVTAKNASAFNTATASGECSHAEGNFSVASGFASHAEGCNTGIIVEGSDVNSTVASGDGSHAEGMKTKANGDYSHSEGSFTIANGQSAHAEGDNTTASGNQSHAEGLATKAIGIASHAEGYGSEAGGSYAHAGGMFTTANKNFLTAIGTYNKEATDDNDVFIIGSGTGINTRINCFRVQAFTGVFGCGSYNASGADYAELFQWLDNNVNNEDRAGLFVTLKGKKICIAQPTDNYILGIISVNPSVVGDVHDDQWNKMYLTDIFGRILFEEIEIDGCKRKVPKLNPNYDNTKQYIPRSQRPEWAAVGMLGKLVVIDDGSCIAEGFCTVGNGGIATKAQYNKGYYVMSRLDDNHIQILFR